MNTINRVYSGSSIRLTPLTPSMVAGKTLTLEAPACPNNVSINTYSADGSIILVGLDGPSVAVGSTFVVLTLNRGLNPDGSHSFLAWDRMKILAVQ